MFVVSGGEPFFISGPLMVVRSALKPVNKKRVGENQINPPPLEPQPGRTVTLPFSGEGFIVKSLDRPQPGRTREHRNIFPLLIALPNLLRHSSRELPVYPAVLLDAPHAILCLYH